MEAEDQGSVLTLLRFDADRSAVLTDNLFETTKGATSNFDDPHELVNLARDPARRAELRDNYHRLLEYEQASFSC